MKIAMFGQKRIPSREGGVEIVVEELSTRMAMAGHDVTCYNRRGHHVSGSEYDTKEKKEYKNVRIKSVPTIEKKGLAAVSSSFFAALCSAFGGYDVVHIHAEGPAAFCFIPKIFRKKVIVTVHGLDWQREKWKAGFGSKYIHFGEKMAVKYADEIIVLSSEVKKYFKDTYGRKTRYIPNGVIRPDKIEADLIEKKFGLKKDSYILYLGRIVPEKGEHYLIEAFKDIETNKKLVIAGGSSDTDEYMEQLKQMAEQDNAADGYERADERAEQDGQQIVQQHIELAVDRNGERNGRRRQEERDQLTGFLIGLVRRAAHDEQNADENGRDQQRIAQRRAGFLLDRHADGVAEDGQEHPGQGRSQNFSHGRMPPHFHDAGA